MAKMRSPNYPALTLSESIERIRQVYGAEHTHPASREVLAKDMGYNSLSGASLPILGALRRYTLLVDDTDGQMRVSDDAVAILELPETDSERRNALRRVAFAPDLFADLRDEFGEQLPSDANLRHYLIKRKFLPKAADEVIRIYRENLGLVGIKDEGYNPGMELAISPNTAPPSVIPGSIRQQEPKPTHIVVIANDSREDVCSLAEGNVTINWPKALSAESFEDLKDWLEMMKRKIGRSVIQEPSSEGS